VHGRSARISKKSCSIQACRDHFELLLPVIKERKFQNILFSFSFCIEKWNSLRTTTLKNQIKPVKVEEKIYQVLHFIRRV